MDARLTRIVSLSLFISLCLFVPSEAESQEQAATNEELPDSRNVMTQPGIRVIGNAFPEWSVRYRNYALCVSADGMGLVGFHGDLVVRLDSSNMEPVAECRLEYDRIVSLGLLKSGSIVALTEWSSIEPRRLDGVSDKSEEGVKDLIAKTRNYSLVWLDKDLEIEREQRLPVTRFDGDANGVEEKSFFRLFDNVAKLSFAREADVFVTISLDDEVRVYRRHRWTRPLRHKSGNGKISSVALSSNGSTLAVGLADTRVELWDFPEVFANW